MDYILASVKKLRPREITLIVFGGIIVFYTLTLMRYPQPWFDEPLYISRAWSTLHPEQGNDLWSAGSFDQFEGHWTILSWLVNVILMVGVAIAGSPSLLASRLIVMFWGIWLLAAIYWIGKKFGGYPLAIGGVIMLALSWAFLVSAHMVRPDIISSAFGYTAVALYLNNQHSRWWVSSLTGLVAILAFEVHANGAFFMPVLLCMFIVDHGKNLLRQRTFWYFILGSITGGLGYLATHVLLFPETYRAIMVSVYSEAYRPPILLMDPMELWRGVAYYWKFFLTRYVLLFPILIIALASLLRSKSKVDKTFFTFIVAVLVGYSWWVRWKFNYYEIYFVPPLQIALASYLLDFIRKPRTNSWIYRSSFVLILTAYLSVSLASIAPAILNNEYPAYVQAQQRVNESIRPDDILLASNIYWLGLSEHKYYSIDQLSFFRWFNPDSTLEMNLNQIRPDIFIYDEQARQYSTDDSRGWPYAGYVYIPKTELEVFLAKNASLVDQFSGAYGFTEIYRINWGK